MTFISYAQNLEDVMLWRALKHVKNGFYIDIGANHPEVDSVTRAFYEKGWSGINIEPLLTFHQHLVNERSRDINLLCAAGKNQGQIRIWECDIPGWTTASEEVILMHEANGHEGKSSLVPMITLSEICNKYVENEIHFLKIDVEGFEKEVIEGMDFSRFRPWVLIVEATKPNSTEEIYQSWEYLIEDANYLFAYSDGLNRFYVANEHQYLLSAFKYPPNVFDEYKLSALQKTEIRLQQAEARLVERSIEIKAIYDSNSWRMTKPLRCFFSIFKSQGS